MKKIEDLENFSRGKIADINMQMVLNEERMTKIENQLNNKSFITKKTFNSLESKVQKLESKSNLLPSTNDNYNSSLDNLQNDNNTLRIRINDLEIKNQKVNQIIEKLEGELNSIARQGLGRKVALKPITMRIKKTQKL